MKLELFENRRIGLIPESESDRAWILLFCKEIQENEGIDYEIEFKREDSNGLGGGGYSSVSDYIFTSENQSTIELDWENMQCLSIYSSPL